VDALTRLLAGAQSTLSEWRRLTWADLSFSEVFTTESLLGVLVALALLTLLVRGIAARNAGRTHIVLPAILPGMRRSKATALRHGAFMIFLAGVPFFAVALADPHTSFRHDEVTYTGRRIAILIDGSTSMIMKFPTAGLRTHGDPAYFAAAAAAERFMRMRMAGPYHDLISLIQFGNEAYVLTPFTTDYENVLLGIRLMSDPREWGRFPEYGTTIIRGLEQGLALFRTFNFLKSSGNLMLIFTDGRDDVATFRGRSLTALMEEAGANQIPIYMIRTAAGALMGGVRQDRMWRAAVERSGGRFFPASDEPSLLAALKEIDRVSTGRIDVREYSSARPQFAGYALIAVALWLTAASLQFSVHWFRTFP
jgi:hypothetical protein